MIDTATVKLNSIELNDAATSTSDNNIKVKFNVTNEATQYRIAESQTELNTTEYSTYLSNERYYQVTNTEGLKTIYAQVKNDNSASEIKSASINLVLPVILTSITLNNNELTTESKSIPVSFTIAQGTATHYRIAESESGLTNATWLSYSDNIRYTFSTTGAKTIYAQVKNDVSESSVVNASITIIEAPSKVVVGWNATLNNQCQQVTAESGDVVNQVNVAFHTSYKQQRLIDTEGTNSDIYMQLDSSQYVVNDVFSVAGANNYTSKTTADDTGVYPAAFFNNCQCPASSSQDGTKKTRIRFKLNQGTYKLRILMSPANGFLLEEKYRVVDRKSVV